jgi:hypothetical protein
MTTHDQHQEVPEFTSAPADFTDGQTSVPPQATDQPGFTDQPRSAAPVRSADAPQAQTQSHAQAEPAGSDDALSADTLFADKDLSDLRSRWNEVQATFVDDPRDCVQKADGLVSDTVEQLTSSFSHARSRLEEQWSRGEEASTEDLRLALKRYRDFFDRLLAV